MSTRIADLGAARPPGVALEPQQDVPNPNLHARVAEIRRRHPSVGLALGDSVLVSLAGGPHAAVAGDDQPAR